MEKDFNNLSEEEKSSKSGKIKRYAAYGLVSVCLLAGTALHIIDANIDHLHEYCPLNNVFGVEHQVGRINKEYKNQGITARYVEDSYITEDIIQAIQKTKDDGTIVYSAPSGYSLEGGKAVKSIAHYGKSIVLSQSTDGNESKDYYGIPVPSGRHK